VVPLPTPDTSSMATTSMARQERRWESRRALIVQAAIDVFAEMGLEGATLEAVGERVGLTKASLYYYVKSKEELLGHVVEHVVRAQERATADLTHEGMTPEERLRVFCLGHLRSLFGDPAGRIAAESLAAYPPGVPNVLPGERLTVETLEYVQRALEQGGSLRGASDRRLRTVRVVAE